MIDHLSVGVDDIEKATSFYDALFATIGGKRIAALDTLVAYGKDTIDFLAMIPHDKEAFSAGNGVHIAFVAETNDQVTAFHKAALANGGSCEGAPGTRPYPHAEVFASYVRDPFGNKLEVIVGGFNG